MAIANIFRSDGEQTVIYEDGRVVHIKSDPAKPIWVVTVRKVRFKMYDDGRVERETGCFTPDEPILYADLKHLKRLWKIQQKELQRAR